MATQRLAKKVLLIGWDAADWRMMDPLLEQGRMPNLSGLLGRSVRGNIASMRPMLSPMLWTSIATGKHADRHNILGFAEPDGTTGKIRPVTSSSRRCKAIWNILSEQGVASGAINWFASHPAEQINGFVVSDRYAPAVAPIGEDWPIPPGCIHPGSLADRAAPLRVHPAHISPEQVERFIPDFRSITDLKSSRIPLLRQILAQGATVHIAATWLMQEQPWEFCGIYYDTIDRMGHGFMEFHPPRRQEIDAREFELYRNVMNECYVFHDMMLGRLLQLAGEDAVIIIVSDHGFYSDDQRPRGTSRIEEGQPVAWHRPYGALVIGGPGIRSGESIYGASLLDLAPTILSLFGLPVPNDMDGMPLMQIFEAPFEPQTIESYESEADAADDQPTEPEDPWLAAAMLEQLQALGYIDADDTESIVIDRMRNLGQVYLSTGRVELAFDQFRQVLDRKPEEKAARLAVASCLLQLGRLDECERLVREVLTDATDAPRAEVFMGNLCFRKGDHDGALAHLERALHHTPDDPDIHVQIGEVHLRRKDWTSARERFEQALALDPDHAIALDGLGVSLRHTGDRAAAVLCHMKSVALLHHRPLSHIHLGVALTDTGRLRWAERAFMVAMQLAPNDHRPHECLARLYEHALKRPIKAGIHRTRARELLEHAKKRLDRH